MADAARAMVAETVKEAGCLTYASSRDINDPDLICMAERWETAASPSSRAAAASLGARLVEEGLAEPRRGRRSSWCLAID